MKAEMSSAEEQLIRK